jgi:hypothetical protein
MTSVVILACTDFHWKGRNDYVNPVTVWPNGLVQRQVSRLVFRKCSVRIPVTTVLTDIFHAFPQSLQENADAVLRLGNERFLPNPLQFIIHWPISERECLRAVRSGCCFLVSCFVYFSTLMTEAVISSETPMITWHPNSQDMWNTS